MDEKKIAIVTLQTMRGHGQRLQNYATAVICSREGYETQNLILDDSAFRKQVDRAKGFAKRLLKKEGSTVSPERYQSFKKFNDLMSFRTINWKDASIIAHDYKWIITGSDQVWNSTWLDKRHLDWYYLKFASPAQRIALAPSLGLSSLSKEQAEIVSAGVEGFSHLSIREKRGAELIREATGREASVIADPTLVVPAEEWIRIAEYNVVPTEPYLLAYMLGNIGNEFHQATEVTASVYGHLPIVYLSDKARSGEPPAGPADFIGLIDRASCVITDSFHASVFAMLMNTPLVITHREDRNQGMFSRLESLADTYSLQKNIFGNASFNLETLGDYTQSASAIIAERERFMKYLRSCLHE